MTCLDCSYCKEKKGIVSCAKGNWFGNGYAGEITFIKKFLDTAPKQKKTQLVRFWTNCNDFRSAL